MSDQATQTDAQEQTASESTDDQRVPYERFQSANRKAKDAAERAATLERQVADLQDQVVEREQKQLPELEQLKRRLDAAERKVQDAEGRASAFETEASNARKERMVARAAQDARFVYPDDASLHLNLAEVDSEEDAVRAVKRLAKARPKLIESESPGPDLKRVLRDGQVITETEDGEPVDKAGEEFLAQIHAAQRSAGWVSTPFS